MMYRDDLYQANRRVEDLEAELRAARADRDQLAGAAVVPEPPTVRHSVASSDEPAFWEWWPLLVFVAGTIVYFAGVRPGTLDVDLPLDVIVPSAIFGAAIMLIEVVLRAHSGMPRGPLGRCLVVLAAIVGAPALLMCFLALGGVMSVVGPIVGVIVVVVCVIQWIAKG